MCCGSTNSVDGCAVGPLTVWTSWMWCAVRCPGLGPWDQRREPAGWSERLGLRLNQLPVGQLRLRRRLWNAAGATQA
eukprot:1191981-Prorocentrum_minimum.AAC.1